MEQAKTTKGILDCLVDCEKHLHVFLQELWLVEDMRGFQDCFFDSSLKTSILEIAH